jgi:hypothetical protein
MMGVIVDNPVTTNHGASYFPNVNIPIGWQRTERANEKEGARRLNETKSGGSARANHRKDSENTGADRNVLEQRSRAPHLRFPASLSAAVLCDRL